MQSDLHRGCHCLTPAEIDCEAVAEYFGDLR